ncbi:MAG: J domain-containing protein [Desulfatibacillaceae bacterium]
MYLAKHRKHGINRFFIRESFNDGTRLASRDLFDLGSDPTDYLVYPGGTSFYIHEQVYDRLRDLGVEPDEDELEKVFWPFLDPETRRVIDGFSHGGAAKRAERRKRIKKQCARCENQDFHMFDKRRVHYLRFGELDQSRIARAPKKLYRHLLDKSRDEIEQYFMESESCLRRHERKTYAYVIFDVPGRISGIVARKVPGALPREQIDDCFLEQLCEVNSDAGFWAGMGDDPGRVRDYLVRYVCWFFDNDFERSQYMEDLFQDWIARHRRFSPPPPRNTMAVDEAVAAMGITPEEFSGMNVKTLTRQYRLMAARVHPDKGGDHDTFVKLGQAFEGLLRKLKGAADPKGPFSTRHHG